VREQAIKTVDQDNSACTRNETLYLQIEEALCGHFCLSVHCAEQSLVLLVQPPTPQHIGIDSPRPVYPNKPLWTCFKPIFCSRGAPRGTLQQRTTIFSSDSVHSLLFSGPAITSLANNSGRNAENLNPMLLKIGLQFISTYHTSTTENHKRSLGGGYRVDAPLNVLHILSFCASRSGVTKQILLYANTIVCLKSKYLAPKISGELRHWKKKTTKTAESL